MKLSLIKTIFVCALLSGTTIAVQNRTEKSSDGPISVNLGEVYKKGNIKIEDADVSGLPSLPRGYSAMPRMAYRITTDAEAVGPYTVVFGVPSISDEQVFNRLRIFHIEPEAFDPDSPVWVDRTAGGSDAPASDFSHKTITAYSVELETGIYVIARQTETIAPNTAIADVEVIAQQASEVVQMPGNITLSMIVRNNGPQTATEVGLKQQISRGPVLSMKASQGNCKWKPGWVYCKLGQLAAGASATVAVTIDPQPDFWGLYRSHVEVAGKESDSKPENNTGIASVVTRADTNLAPEVTLDSPDMEQLFEQGATVVFKATASDRDGSITKVEFIDNDKTLGVGSTSDANRFSFTSNQLANGFHVLTAIATDNAGRSTESGAKQVFINGPIRVRILKPTANSPLLAGSDLILMAEAIHPSGSVKKVQFVCNGFSLGEGKAVGNNRYTIKLPGLEITNYSISAIAIDDSGLISKSSDLRLSVRK